MIFVTVGTHEQPFNRLIECMDKLKEANVIEEEIIIQSGFSTYEPQFCKWEKLYPYQKMIDFVYEARIVITHGGPSSFIMPLQFGKIPIVVPRQKKYNEHVNDHQIEFVKEVEDRMGNIIVVSDINNLCYVIKNYEKIIKGKNNDNINNNIRFNRELGIIVDEMFEDNTIC